MKVTFYLCRVLLILMLLFQVNFLAGQENTVHAYAKNKDAGFFYNCGEFTLTISPGKDNKRETDILPRGKDAFTSSAIQINSKWYYRYNEKRFYQRRDELIQKIQEDYQVFLNKAQKTKPEIITVELTFPWNRVSIKEGLNLEDSLSAYSVKIQMSDDGKKWNAIKKEYYALLSSIEDIARNKTFFLGHSTYSDSYYIDAKREFESSRHYTSYHPRFLIDAGWSLAKSGINSNFINKSSRRSFVINGSVGISEEKKIANNTYSKLYFNISYERLCFDLAKNSKYYLNSEYMIEDSNDYYSLPTSKDVSLCIKQLSSGLNYSLIHKKIRVELGAGATLLQSGYVYFSPGVAYGDLKSSKFNVSVQESTSFQLAPYANAAIGLWTRDWIAKGNYLRLSGSVRQMALESSNAIFIYSHDKTGSVYNKIGDFLPNKKTLTDLKLTFGVAF